MSTSTGTTKVRSWPRWLWLSMALAAFAAAAIGVWMLQPSLTELQSGATPRCEMSVPPAPTPHAGMVWVPSGTLAFGDSVYPEEQPIRPVEVKGFWMDRTEVTNDDFAAFIAATGYVTVAERPVDARAHPGLTPDMLRPGAVVFTMPTDLAHGGDLRQWWQYRPGASWHQPGGSGTHIQGRGAFPVVATTIEDARAYARWKGRDLPTEAEWEWAARGGSSLVAGSTAQPVQANTWQGVFPLNNQATDGFAGVAPVGCFAPNGYGLHDMIGNVWELTQNAYLPFHGAGDNTPPDQPPVPHRPGQATGQHVIKGGSYLCAPNYCMRYRAGARQGQDDDLATSHLGFRTILRDTGPVAAHPEKL